ncbi:Agmatine deiminase [Galdieria sulphuraria]|nr:Agmatine deiminase [Galdieria sulphuraria]
MKLEEFVYPAEWVQHSQSWIGWPERPDNWRKDGKPAQEAFVKLIETLSKYEKITVAASISSWKQCRNLLPSNVRIVEIQTNDCWLRDTGPIFLTRKVPCEGSTNICGVDFAFNAWGGSLEGCYPDWEYDSLVTSKILEIERIPRVEASLVLEGGAVVTDGEGTIITTEECLLNRNRNPGMTKKEVEAKLKEYLHVEKVIWLPFGVYGDIDTDGHVDNLCMFAKAGHVVLHWTEDRQDPQYKRSATALEILENSTDARGKKFQIHKVLGPAPQYRTEEEIKELQFTNFRMALSRNTGQRLPASYVNAYIGNGVVILPSYDDPNDKLALDLFQELFPERSVVQVPAREILLGGGGIHCVVLEQPSVNFQLPTHKK